MAVALCVLPFFVDMEGEIPASFRPIFVASLALLVLSVIGVWFFIIYDIIHVARNQALSGGAKAGWICAIWFLNVFVIPVYWLKHQRNVR
jgi:hypothetical protein